MKASVLKALNAARGRREAVALVTPIAGGESRLVRAGEEGPLAKTVAARMASAKSGVEEIDGERVFIAIHRPPPRLVVVGAVHVSQALAPMAIATGFDVTIVDPRTAFASEERFSGVRLLAEWPEPEILALDRESALATLTHDPKIDDPALTAGLRADCFYLGALGSRKTHARRVERLTEAGFDEAALSRIHAPIGLPIGAASPAEIAVAVLAEVVSALRKAPRGATRPAASVPEVKGADTRPEPAL